MKHPWSITLSPFHQLCHQWKRRGERDETNCLSIDKTIAVPVFPLMASSYNMRLSATNSQRNARNIVRTNNIVQEAISNTPFSACFFYTPCASSSSGYLKLSYDLCSVMCQKLAYLRHRPMLCQKLSELRHRPVLCQKLSELRHRPVLCQKLSEKWI